MIFFWLLYFFFSFLIAYFFTFFIEKRFFKILTFSIVLSTIASFWFKTPGESSLVPIISIFLLESTILENNGYLRILRPYGLFLLVIFVTSLIFWKKKSKN
tara:strand:- start:1002 stop:1304 length:303 start_codon:yes stop_codon:yes gene_type:complete